VLERTEPSPEGTMKDAHAVPMHAIQAFLVLAWLVGFSGLRQRRRTWLVGLDPPDVAGHVSA